MKDKPFRELGESIKKVRAEKELTQEQMATLIGMGERMLQKYETGHSVPKTKRTFDKYMKAVEDVRTGKVNISANISRGTFNQTEQQNEVARYSDYDNQTMKAMMLVIESQRETIKRLEKDLTEANEKIEKQNNHVKKLIPHHKKPHT